MATTSKIVTSAAEVMAIKSEWQNLLDNSEADNLFLTPDWILCWLETVNEDAELFIITVYEDNHLIGIAPFYITTITMFKVLPLKCLRIAADQHTSSEYQDLIYHKKYGNEASKKIAAVLQSNQQRFSLLWAPYTKVGSGASKRFEKLITILNFLSHKRQIAYYTIHLPNSPQSFEASLSSKQRNNIRRYSKKLESESTISLVNLAESLDADQAFTIMTQLHESRWQLKGESGTFKRKPLFARFIQEFSRISAKNNSLAALCLYRNDEAIAIRYGFIYKNKLVEIQAGFLPNFNGSGIVSIKRSIEFAIANGLTTYDFLAFGGDYKSRFNASEEDGQSIFAGKRNLINKLIFEFGLWPTGRFLRQN